MLLLCTHIGAARTYFKTRKSAHQRKRNGKERTTAIAARHRQRKHNVCIFKFCCYNSTLLQKAHA